MAPVRMPFRILNSFVFPFMLHFMVVFVKCYSHPSIIVHAVAAFVKDAEQDKVLDLLKRMMLCFIRKFSVHTQTHYFLIHLLLH